MRILDSGLVGRDLESLGMREFERCSVRVAITKPYGAILVTGPTGSGKSTTLYAALGRINDGRAQHRHDRGSRRVADRWASSRCRCPRRRASRLPAGLRSMLRADPDVIMVGEIRDRETADDRRPGRADRPPRALDAAHARRPERGHADDRHGNRAVHDRRGGRLRGRAAPRARRCARTASGTARVPGQCGPSTAWATPSCSSRSDASAAATPASTAGSGSTR